jgi:starch phosphorylase
MIKAIDSFQVLPTLPEELKDLREIAYNLLWTWNQDTIELFRRLDRELWETSGHNPAQMLGTVRQELLVEAARDEGFIAHLERVATHLRQYMSASTWFAKKHGAFEKPYIAYFSMEFGLTECLQIYSGGLGTLAGDHLKSASELGLPLAGVGLLYQEGYFQQYLNEDGWQQEYYPDNDFYNLPILRERGPDGQIVTVDVRLPGRTAKVQVWRAQVGRIPLFLLDTNLPDNTPEDRRITYQLYGGDKEMRLKQEIVLGIGGILALHAMGMPPMVCHMNEGHSAFLSLGRIRMRREESGLSIEEALQALGSGTVFTTHTPVPAGIDEFPPELIEKYFVSQGHSKDEMPVSELLKLGRRHPENPREPFNMAMLALRRAEYANAVSQLHGEVSRRMWMDAWPGLPEHEIPIDSITNGIHSRSWISYEMATLFDRYLGPDWSNKPHDHTIWNDVDQIPDEELWRTHERRRERLVAYTRRRLRKQLEQRGARPSLIQAAHEVLDPDTLTIGFARRFATYKRATLLLHDPDRLKGILCNPDRPVQIIYAGKAHPRDDEGKAFIKAIVHFAQDEAIRRHIVFLENYDMSVARYLVEGVDIWLNTPRRPLEASGTSGMKVLPNGGLNLSVLDGWWCEGYFPETGWAIGHGEEYDDHDYQDRVESSSLYGLLEKEVIPLFYDRGPDDLPRGWIAKMKASMRQLCPIFNTNRMVMEYCERYYVPARDLYDKLFLGDIQPARDLASWKSRVRGAWRDVRLLSVQADVGGTTGVGADVKVQAQVRLGSLTPGDVSVQIYSGTLNADRFIERGSIIPMDVKPDAHDGAYTYEGTIPCRQSGLHGYSVRVIPSHPHVPNPLRLGLITWANP